MTNLPPIVSRLAGWDLAGKRPFNYGSGLIPKNNDKVADEKNASARSWKPGAYEPDEVLQTGGIRQAGYEKKGGPKGRLYVIAVGVNNYDKESYTSQYGSAPGDLQFCVNDAEKLSRSIQSPMCPAENITVLVNEQATWDNIRAAVDKTKKKMAPDDELTFHFSGHGSNGTNETGERDGFICLYNEMVSGYKLSELGDKLGKNEGLFVFDSCRSGALIGKEYDKSESALPAGVRFFNWRGSVANDEWAYASFLKNLDRRNVFVITSSAGNEYSQEDPRLRHGYFTYALIQALDGAPYQTSAGTYYPDYTGDGLLSAEELVPAASWKTLRLSGGRQHPQYSDNDKFQELIVKTSS